MGNFWLHRLVAKDGWFSTSGPGFKAQWSHLIQSWCNGQHSGL